MTALRTGDDQYGPPPIFTTVCRQPLSARPKRPASTPDGAGAPDQDACANEASDEVSEPAAERHAQKTEDEAGDSRADDTEYDVHEHAGVAVHEP